MYHVSTVSNFGDCYLHTNTSNCLSNTYDILAERDMSLLLVDFIFSAHIYSLKITVLLNENYLESHSSEQANK